MSYKKEFGICICLGCNNSFSREFLKNQKMCPIETCSGELKNMKIDSRRSIE